MSILLVSNLNEQNTHQFALTVNDTTMHAGIGGYRIASMCTLNEHVTQSCRQSNVCLNICCTENKTVDLSENLIYAS